MEPLALLKRRAEQLGKDADAFLLELLAREADPPERVEAYLAASDWFWREGLRLLSLGDLRQASEKIWNAVVQSVKAYAEVSGLPHDSHRLIWAVVRRLARDKPELITMFAAVEQLHINFYEGHLERGDIEALLKAAESVRSHAVEMAKSAQRRG
ncbi:PaREP1 family protein [Pyrobaculum sp.]|uniref:PaREP1 family protein n=1 Tax=Pyrobaculum sp. TaxID=2004705 RepID=UPI003D0A5041